MEVSSNSPLEALKAQLIWDLGLQKPRSTGVSTFDAISQATVSLVLPDLDQSHKGKHSLDFFHFDEKIFRVEIPRDLRGQSPRLIVLIAFVLLRAAHSSSTGQSTDRCTGSFLCLVLGD